MMHPTPPPTGVSLPITRTVDVATRATTAATHAQSALYRSTLAVAAAETFLATATLTVVPGSTAAVAPTSATEDRLLEVAAYINHAGMCGVLDALDTKRILAYAEYACALPVGYPVGYVFNYSGSSIITATLFEADASYALTTIMALAANVDATTGGPPLSSLSTVNYGIVTSLLFEAVRSAIAANADTDRIEIANFLMRKGARMTYGEFKWACYAESKRLRGVTTFSQLELLETTDQGVIHMLNNIQAEHNFAVDEAALAYYDGGCDAVVCNVLFPVILKHRLRSEFAAVITTKQLPVRHEREFPGLPDVGRGVAEFSVADTVPIDRALAADPRAKAVYYVGAGADRGGSWTIFTPEDVASISETSDMIVYECPVTPMSPDPAHQGEPAVRLTLNATTYVHRVDLKRPNDSVHRKFLCVKDVLTNFKNIYSLQAFGRCSNYLGTAHCDAGSAARLFSTILALVNSDAPRPGHHHYGSAAGLQCRTCTKNKVPLKTKNIPTKNIPTKNFPP